MKTFRRLLTKKKCEKYSYISRKNCPLAHEILKVVKNGVEVAVETGHIDLEWEGVNARVYVTGKWNVYTYGEIREGKRQGFRIRFTIPNHFLKEECK